MPCVQGHGCRSNRSSSMGHHWVMGGLHLALGSISSKIHVFLTVSALLPIFGKSGVHEFNKILYARSSSVAYYYAMATISVTFPGGWTLERSFMVVNWKKNDVFSYVFQYNNTKYGLNCLVTIEISLSYPADV